MARTVKGFRFAGIASGVKANGALDLGLIAADEPANVAGVFTRNLVRAAPVLLGQRRVRAGVCQAVLVNSGNANACTGEQGRQAALSLTAAMAAELKIKRSLVVPASTGVIGVQLPVSRIERALPELASSRSVRGANLFAEAILTTDRGPKVTHTTVQLGRQRCSVLGIAKGAGMIHPQMATTLAFVVTDARIDSATLQRTLSQATEQTFNRATVDGDTSTNDTILALASGAASGRSVSASASGRSAMRDAMTEVLGELAQRIVADGEGAKHLVRVEVTDARSEAVALRVARTVAGSLLVKTALHGCDPNWGRILAAAGRAGVPLREDRVSISVGNAKVYDRGAPAMNARVERAAAKTMKKNRYTITISLGQGRATGHYWTCDIGHEYVRINADYRT